MILALACASPTANFTVTEREWRSDEIGVVIDFPAGWLLAVEPDDFRGGFEYTLLEASLGEVFVAMSWHEPPLLLLDEANALDLLSLYAPAEPLETTRYLLERLQSCDGAIFRQFDERLHLALRNERGLILFHGWGPSPTLGAQALQTLVCDSTRRL